MVTGKTKRWRAVLISSIGVLGLGTLYFFQWPRITEFMFTGDGEYEISHYLFATHSLTLPTSRPSDDGRLVFQFRGFDPSCPTFVSIHMPDADLKELKNDNAELRVSLYQSGELKPIFQSNVRIEEEAIHRFPERIEEMSRWRSYTIELSALNGEGSLLDVPLMVMLWSGWICEPLM